MESLRRLPRRVNTLSAAAILSLLVMVVAASPNASTGSPQITFSSPTTTSLTGKVKWQVDVSPDSVSRVDFYIDGTLRWTEYAYPYVYNGDQGTLDTTTLSNGDHTLTARAKLKRAPSVSASQAITVANGAAPVAPAATAPPSISGTPVVGAQLTTTAGTWSGTQPIDLGLAWQRCVLGTCSAIAGATSTSYTAATADVGATLEVTATGTNAAGTYTVSSLPTGVVSNSVSSTPPSPSSTPSFPALPARPAFTAKRTVNATTQSQFLSALSNLQPGDLVNVSPMTLTGEIVIHANLADYAEIDFASGVHFAGAAAGSRLPSVWVVGTSKLRLFGGEITGNGNDGVRIEDSSYVTWQGFTIHDTAGTGLYVHGISRGTDHLDLYGEIYHCGWDYLNLDPHVEKGTGIHAAYLGGGNLPTTTSSFVLDIHDQSVGSAVEAGSMLQNSDLWIRAKRITFVATQQVAGNAIQVWGDLDQKLRLHYLEAEDVTRAVEGDGLYSSTAPDALTVEYARTLRSRLAPYPVYRGIVYGDVG